jgi:hypothetical protein
MKCSSSGARTSGISTTRSTSTGTWSTCCAARRDTESAQAFFRQARERTGQAPTQVITDHHQPYSEAVERVLPEAEHIRTGLHRVRGGTTRPIERSHVPTRDRLRAARGLKTLATGQRFLEGFEALHALRRGHIVLSDLLPGQGRAPVSFHEPARAVVTAVNTLGARLTKEVRV